MNRVTQPIFAAAIAVAFFGTLQVNQTALAQEPDKDKKPAAQRAPPAARAAPRAAPATPRQVAQPPAPRPAARAPATVQRARPQRPEAVQRAQPQRPAAVQRAPQQRQVQERQRQLRPRQAVPQQSAPKQVEQGSRHPDVATGSSAQPVARLQATDQQRREVRQRLSGNHQRERISLSRLNAPLAIGSRIPRGHRLQRFAPALLALVPAYAAYRYLIVDDTICVVDPESYAIIDLIPSSIEQASPRPMERPALALSADQMRCVYAATPKDQARTDLHIRLALGAEIPRNVELFAFPEEGLACAPELVGYRHIVVDDDVVIVDPADYAVAGVISG
jgi:Protein of unknown function (DUF1236)